MFLLAILCRLLGLTALLFCRLDRMMLAIAVPFSLVRHACCLMASFTF